MAQVVCRPPTSLRQDGPRPVITTSPLRRHKQALNKLTATLPNSPYTLTWTTPPPSIISQHQSFDVSLTVRTTSTINLHPPMLAFASLTNPNGIPSLAVLSAQQDGRPRLMSSIAPAIPPRSHGSNHSFSLGTGRSSRAMVGHADFADLEIRTAGSYRVRLTLVQIKDGQYETLGWVDSGVVTVCERGKRRRGSRAI